MDEFMNALFGAKEVKASAREKRGNETRTVALRDTLPTDTSDEAFLQAAREGGVNLSVKVNKTDERGRTYSGKGVFGAAAVKATSSVLGYVPAPEPTPAPAPEVPEPVKKRGRSVVAEPSVNGSAAADGATKS